MAETPNPEVSGKMESFSESIVFKGYKTGLTLVIPEAGSLEGYMQDIRARLEQSHDFFKGAHIIIELGKRLIAEKERLALKEAVQEFGLNPRFAEEVKNNEKIEEPDQFESTITVRKTVRSGQRISFGGNLVIMGDVNPGAEVIASGDIIVLGRLRGTAHAGAEGDETAKIVAFQLRPVQIRIAGVITRDSESSSKAKYLGPEIARIKDGMILVERVSY